MTTNDSIPIPARVKDLTGQCFGKLVVIRYIGNGDNSRKEALWLCRCECGNTTVVPGVSLCSGNTRSCSRSCGNKKHGMSYTPEYMAWCQMRSRCNNPSNPAFNYYGGREEKAITICERWELFENFLADMGLKPFHKASLGRIDNEGPYSPENTRWEDDEQQQNNKRDSHYLTHDGETLTVSQWARQLGMHTSTLDNRISSGWSTTKAITTPVQYHSPSRHRHVSHPVV